MGVPGQKEDDTVCNQGCAMSCVSMALAGYNITIDGQTSNPGTLNAWLRANDGYECAGGDCCNLILDAPTRISPRIRSLGEPLVPSLETLVSWVKSGYITIIHVRNQHHFVLVTDFKAPDVFVVNDPGFDQTEYHYSDIHDILLYTIVTP
eukprot:TRINITY_DN2297_c0_g1_i2.p1 TRINITY_DN2297_c0_g1~~TRINITY_DN2297_c0_g1_i2.p1  ORF type:complete len:150 (-),score=37.16 TRINITY_DN2297_c0_g1_i2:63-512(-)